MEFSFSFHGFTKGYRQNRRMQLMHSFSGRWQNVRKKGPEDREARKVVFRSGNEAPHTGRTLESTVAHLGKTAPPL
jgi:hypothetical protein